MKTVIRVIVIACCLLAADILMDGLFNRNMPLKTEAEARIGRPLTPVSVAGVARRTTRQQSAEPRLTLLLCQGGALPSLSKAPHFTSAAVPITSLTAPST